MHACRKLTISGVTSKSTNSSGKPAMSINSPTKRPFDPAMIFEDYDSENVDPAANLTSPNKKSKSDATEKPFKPFTFTMTPSKAMPPPPSRLSTPARAHISSPRAPLTAPAGRSPTKRKSAGLLNTKNRRTSAPFSRIDPPSFNASRSTSSLPFSLDAALSGTFSFTPASTSSKMSAGATIAESMPKNWFFEIYEDTPEEEASNLMEHSTLTLDLSSDDESEKKLNDERGKENMPPEGYDAVTASRQVGDAGAAAPARVKKADIVRKKVVAEEMDDGERSPLANLETEPFFPEGLDKEAHVIVGPTPEKSREESKSIFAAPVPFTAGSEQKSGKKSSGLVSTPLVNSQGEVKGEITIWDDGSSSEAVPSADVSPKTFCEDKGKAVDDENALPKDDDAEL